MFPFVLQDPVFGWDEQAEPNAEPDGLAFTDAETLAVAEYHISMEHEFRAGWSAT